MRNGILLAEDSPQNILSIFGTTTLEDAFLILSQNQGQSEEADITIRKVNDDTQSIKSIKVGGGGGVGGDSLQDLEKDENPAIRDRCRRNKSFAEQKPKGVLGKLTFTSKTRMKALLMKNFLQLIRQPS